MEEESDECLDKRGYRVLIKDVEMKEEMKCSNRMRIAGVNGR